MTKDSKKKDDICIPCIESTGAAVILNVCNDLKDINCKDLKRKAMMDEITPLEVISLIEQKAKEQHRKDILEHVTAVKNLIKDTIKQYGNYEK